jgi:hypothetical protein
MSEHVIRIVPKPGVAEAEYLECYLRSTEGQAALSRGVFGSVIDEITPEFIEGLEVPIPKSRQLLDRIVTHLRGARAARQSSIENMLAAVSTLENALGNGGTSWMTTPTQDFEEALR